MGAPFASGLAVELSVLRVEQLVVEFPLKGSKDAVHAVNGVDFAIEEGRTLGLIGESGSGKTTVGRCVLRLLTPTSGRVIFMNRDLATVGGRALRELRQKLQLVFQEPVDALNPRMTVGQILEEPLKLARHRKAPRRGRVAELLKLVDLHPAMTERFPHQLSGGEQQRVGIARAMATSPKLVVLDEPTSALDVAVRAEILDLLRRLQVETGVSYLFISHDLTAVRAVSHEVAVMYLGRIVERSVTAELFRAQAHPYSQALLASVLMPTTVEELQPVRLSGEIPSPIHLPSGCHLHPRCPRAAEVCKTTVPALAPIDGETARSAACLFRDDVVQEPSAVPRAVLEFWKPNSEAAPDEEADVLGAKGEG